MKKNNWFNFSKTKKNIKENSNFDDNSKSFLDLEDNIDEDFDINLDLKPINYQETEENKEEDSLLNANNNVFNEEDIISNTTEHLLNNDLAKDKKEEKKWFSFMQKKKKKEKYKKIEKEINEEIAQIDPVEEALKQIEIQQNKELEELEKIKQEHKLHETQENMAILEKIDVWKKNFSKINNKSKTEEKKNIITSLWDKMSFISKTIYKTTVIYLISLFWVLFWTTMGGWEKYNVIKFVIYSFSIILFLLGLQLWIYINNIKNKGNSKRIINYYINNTIVSVFNILARINFLLTPFFIRFLLILGDLKDNDLIIFGKLEVATSAPTFSLLFAMIFYLPVNWGKIQSKIIESFGIFYLLSQLYLLKNYKNHQTDNLYKRASDNWIKLNKIYNKPLGMAYHPEFIKTTIFLEEQGEKLDKQERLQIIAKMKQIIEKHLNF